MQNRYRSMDTLRAIAILLVILAHSILAFGAPNTLAPLQLGGTGVDLFFVLSGWLLGNQIFKEIDTTGSLNVRRFWIRRWMRTLPAYYAILIFSVIQRYATKTDIDFPWQYFIFIQNYQTDLPFFSVSWSLCVEEQFYLLIAPLLLFLNSTNKKVQVTIILLLLFAPSLFRYLELYSHLEQSHVRFDGCIAGVLGAYIYQSKLKDLVMRHIVGISLAFLSVYIFFYVGRYFPNIGIQEPSKLLLATIFLSWVFVANKNQGFQKLLYFPGANYIATRSYALYLLHPEILALMKRFFLDTPFAIFLVFTLLGSCILAEVLYRVVEKPIMDAREKISLSRQ